MLDRYVAQVRLLVSVLPDVAAETAFALKGGTAINLFYRNMPRLSVDIDLTWLPVGDRPSSLREIDSALNRIATSIVHRDPKVTARSTGGSGNGYTRIVVTRSRVQIKIETSPEALIEAGHRLREDIGKRLTGGVATFLLSLHDAEPDFGLIGLPAAAELPAVRWKIVNLDRLKQANPDKHAAQRNALENLFQ